MNEAVATASSFNKDKVIRYSLFVIVMVLYTLPIPTALYRLARRQSYAHTWARQLFVLASRA